MFEQLDQVSRLPLGFAAVAIFQMAEDQAVERTCRRIGVKLKGVEADIVLEAGGTISGLVQRQQEFLKLRHDLGTLAVFDELPEQMAGYQSRFIGLPGDSCRRLTPGEGDGLLRRNRGQPRGDLCL